MTIDSRREILKIIKQRKYLNRDFDGFRADLLEYAKTHFPDNIKDFSESSLGGLLLEFAAYVGDVDSFYLDHQFHEMNHETAVETKNIENHLKRAGVPIVGASPAVVTQTFLVEVPAADGAPDVAALPVIHASTIIPSDDGVQFELTEDLDFRDMDESGNLVASRVVGSLDSSGTPTSFILSLPGDCISGFRATETFSVGAFQPFKKFTLSKENVSEVIDVKDNLGNDYFEVGNLTQDSVFQSMVNRTRDNDLVKESLVVAPAPFRFQADTSLETRLTTLTFGGGSAQSLDDDIIPDPSEFAVPLYGKKNFSRFTLNPNNLLQTTTLGVIAPNSTLTINYRYGGGLSHNAGANTIRGITTLIMSFPNDPSADVAQFVRASADSINKKDAAGGEDPPTIDELRTKIPAIKASQGRIVTREDLIARIYTMPSNFGRVFRATVLPDPENSLVSRIFIISRNADNQLICSPDTLKENLSIYLNQFRLTTDAIDILDAQRVNFKIDFSIVTDPSFGNKNLIKQNVIAKLKKYFNIKNFEINQPIFINDVENIIYNNAGVLTINNLKITNINGTVSAGSESSGNRVYSDVEYDIASNTDRKIIFGPAGGIFELRYPDFDIRATIQ